MLIIRISNTYDGKEKFNSVMGIKTSKKDKELHGYGIKSIRHMVESVDGDFEIHTKEKWFVADVVIPLLTGSKAAMHGERISVRHIAVKESEVIDWQDHILNKPDWAQ